MIKESLDKKFGSSWHAVVGEGYGFELTHEVKNLLYMYFGGTVAVCVWKCSWNDHYFTWRFICCWNSYMYKTNIQNNIACLIGNTEIVIVRTLSSSTKQGDYLILTVEIEDKVNVIFEFLGIFIRRGLTACSDLLFTSQSSICHLYFGSYWESLFFMQHLSISVSWRSSLQHKLHCAPNST